MKDKLFKVCFITQFLPVGKQNDQQRVPINHFVAQKSVLKLSTDYPILYYSI